MQTSVHFARRAGHDEGGCAPPSPTRRSQTTSLKSNNMPSLAQTR